jgi:hypothetical protein
MNPYDVMREWDRVLGNPPRSDDELDREIPATLPSGDYEGWKSRLAAGDTETIIEGMGLWGLPVAPLRPFEADEDILNVERPDSSPE